MPRPTPARVLYLIVGLVLGLLVAIAVQIYVLPAVIAAVPFLTQPPPATVQPSGPAQFSGATLDRVIALNMLQEHGGVAIRLNSMEMYADGVSLTYTVFSGRGGLSAPTLEPEAIRVSDDRGVSYSLSPLGTTAALSAGLTVGIVSFSPAVPAGAQVFRVSIPNVIAVGLRLPEGQTRVTPGPWTFEVTIPARSG